MYSSDYQFIHCVHLSECTIFRYEQHIQSVEKCAVDVIQIQKKLEEPFEPLKKIKNLEEEIAQLEEKIRAENVRWMTKNHLTELQKQLGHYRMKHRERLSHELFHDLLRCYLENTSTVMPSILF